MDDEMTMIRVKKSTRERLIRLGRKGETYDEILIRMLDKEEGERHEQPVQEETGS